MTAAKKAAIAGVLARAGVDPDEEVDAPAGARRVERFNWEFGEDIAWELTEADRARFRWEMVQRYRSWEEAARPRYAASEYESAYSRRRDIGRGDDWIFEVVNPIDEGAESPEPRWDERRKKWVVSKNVFDENVVSRRRFLFEIDGMALADQKVLLEPLLRGGVIQRVVFSGNKSLHCVVEETDEPEDKERYGFAWRYIAFHYFGDRRFHDLSLPGKKDERYPEVVDASCGNPSRTTRAPFGIRKDAKTGWKPVEQKLLYFAFNRLDSGWRSGYEQARKRRDAQLERERRRVRSEAWKYRNREKKVPNAAARRFMGGDMSDGWKHESLPSAVASLAACGYGREETAAIFGRYRTNQDGKKSDIPEYAMKCYDYFARRDAGRAADYFVNRNGPTSGASLAGEAAL